MKLVVMDAQGGGMGRLIVEKLKAALPEQKIIAVGTNALATAAMLRAGADAGATGENAVKVCCRDAKVICGPIGLIQPDAMLGEVTPEMAKAVAGSPAVKLLLPVEKCSVRVMGVKSQPLENAVQELVLHVAALLKKEPTAEKEGETA